MTDPEPADLTGDLTFEFPLSEPTIPQYGVAVTEGELLAMLETYASRPELVKHLPSSVRHTLAGYVIEQRAFSQSITKRSIIDMVNPTLRLGPITFT